MNPSQQATWKDAVLREILGAVADYSPLKEALVFKGARILNLHLQTERQSLDIDANLLMEFQRAHPDKAGQAGWFENALAAALRNRFEEQDPVRYQVESVRVARSPEERHPRGWDAYQAHIRVVDDRQRGVKQLPTIELDIAAPEELGPGAIEQIQVDGSEIQAYSLHRIAGEKLRAFLTSLPAYRRKMNGRMRVIRAKDLHDLARILRAKSIEETDFWAQAAHEFRLACRSRYVDCQGPESFREEWAATRAAYESEATLRQVPWVEAEQALEIITRHFADTGVFQLVHPLPETGHEIED